MSIHSFVSSSRTTALALAFAVFLSSPAAAFSPANSLESLGESEREVLDAIAARDADTRDAALLATLYPDTLVRIELIQARSSAAFDLRVKQLDREHQEEIWELVRAEGAMQDIVEGGPKSKAELDRIAARHPERIRDIFGHLGEDHFETLEEAHAIQAAAEIEFENELAPLSDVPRDAFRELLADPELLAMLGRSPSAVSSIGDAFDEDPDATLDLLDKLALEVAESNTQSDEAWRNSFAEDPEAQADLERAARSYADEYGYDYDALTRRDVEVNVYVHQRAYPYWFGYPHWYASWDPWGVWYPVRPHFGFYYGNAGFGSTVFFGSPSLHFVNWYYAGHYSHYPYLSRHIDHHHSRYAHAYRPLHRHHRRHQRGDWHHQGGRNWSPARLTPRAVHAADRRQERREHGVVRRDTRREHMAVRHQTQRENGFERRSVRRANGIERRDARRENMTERRDDRRENGTERREGRRENMAERRDDRRENGTARREDRRENATERRDDRRERASERMSDRASKRAAPKVDGSSPPDASAGPATSTRRAARSSLREPIETRVEARRNARTSRVASRSEAASTRAVERRAASEARIEKRSQARAMRSNSQLTRVQARSTERAQPQRVAREQAKAPSVRAERPRAASQPQRVSQRRERAAVSAGPSSSPSSKRERAVTRSPSPQRERAASPSPSPRRERAASAEPARGRGDRASGSNSSYSLRDRNRGGGGRHQR